MNQTLLILVVVADLVVVFTKASASATRVNRVLHIGITVQESDSVIEPQPASGALKIEFHGVNFSCHLPGEYALQDYGVAIATGETIGITGGTDSGESALVNLTPHFYDVTKSQVLLNRVDVQEYPFTVLRSRAGVVL